MKLYLVQHAQACAKEVDPTRPLTERGREDVERLAIFLQRAGIRVARVIHSGKRRAEQTASGLAAALAPGITPETGGLINPNDDPRGFDWQSGSWDRDTLIVGHLPFIARLVADLLIGDRDRPLIAYQPGSVVCLERAEDGGWRLNWMVRPELLAPPAA